MGFTPWFSRGFSGNRPESRRMGANTGYSGDDEILTAVRRRSERGADGSPKRLKYVGKKTSGVRNVSLSRRNALTLEIPHGFSESPRRDISVGRIVY